jgi:hypothetical protein
MTIVAAGVLYTYFTTTASRAQNTAQVQIQASLVVPSGSGAGSGAITVTNSGSIELTGLTVTSTIPGFTSNGGFSAGALTVPPGSSISSTFTGAGDVSGTSYSITVVATFANGSTQTQVLTVTAQ